MPVTMFLKPAGKPGFNANWFQVVQAGPSWLLAGRNWSRYSEQHFPTLVLEYPQPYAFCQSPLFNTPILGLGVSANKLMS